MNYYDIERIYDEMEQYLIDNIKRNLLGDLSSFHLKEEKELGFDWEAWQATKLRELKRYRRQNNNILHKYVDNIDEDVADVLRKEYQQGKKSAYNGYKKALGLGHNSDVKVKDSWFRVNDRKLNALIKSVNNDFKKANHAVLRKTNDTYRQVIFEASMFNNTGVMTSEQAIRKAIGNFERRGINSIVYSNGSKHRISEYARMAIRTSGTRAYLQGNGEFRKKIGETLVIVSKHGTACKICQQFEGKILIDDVYSGGTKSDGKYMLMSTAMKQGFYHPNCRHALGTYYPDLDDEDNEKITKEVEAEENNIIEATHITSSDNIGAILENGFELRKGRKGIFGKGIYASNDANVTNYYIKSRNNPTAINLEYDTSKYASFVLDGVKEDEKSLFDTLIKQLSEKLQNEYKELLKKYNDEYKYRDAFVKTLKNNKYKGIKFKQDLSSLTKDDYKKYRIQLEKVDGAYIDALTGGSQVVAWDKKTVKIKGVK